MPASILKTISNCPNSRDDVAEFVNVVGTSVIDFHVGDHVAALHELGTPGGTYAEYALVWDWTTFHLGDHGSFEEAATVPMTALMASVGLFSMLEVATGVWAQRSEKPFRYHHVLKGSPSRTLCCRFASVSRGPRGGGLHPTIGTSLWTIKSPK